MASAILKTPHNPISQYTHHGSPAKILNSAEKQGFSAKIMKLCSKIRLKEAVDTLDFIQKPGISPEKLRIYDCLLRSIAAKRDLSLANRVYDHMTGSNLHRSAYFGTKIVSMFVKCGSLANALHVFEGVADKNLHLWSAILNGCCQIGQFDEALRLFYDFSDTHLKPDGFILSSVLRACAGSGNFMLGREVHAFIYRNGYGSDVFLNNCLVDAYGKWGHINDAHTIFDRMSQRDIVSWNSMLKCYSQGRDFGGFVRLVEGMEAAEGLKPNLITWNTMISGYASYGRAKEALNCFRKMQSVGMKPDMVSCNALISALAQHGYFKEALELVQQMGIVGLEPDIVSWTTIIGGYVSSGYLQEALNLISQVPSYGLVLDEFIYSLGLKACCRIQALKQGREIHAHVIRNVFSVDAFLSASLVNMYAKCGRLDCARDLLSDGNIVSWNSLVSGYIQNGYLEEAKELLQQLQLQSVKPDLVSWNLMINCHAQEGNTNEALSILNHMQSVGVLPDSVSWNSLINGYAKRGQIVDAVELLNQELAGYKRDPCSWNTLISTYVKNGYGDEALQTFHLMRIHDVEPDQITISSILQACALLRALRIGKCIHGSIIRRNTQDKYITSALLEMYIKSDALGTARKLFAMTPQANLVLWNGMISGLAKCGRMQEAHRLFHQMGSAKLNPDVISWTSIVLGYIKSGNADVALRVWAKMWRSGVQPDPISLTVASTACADLGMLETAKEIHGFSITTGLEKDQSVQAAIITMYLKCGSIKEAESMFDRASLCCTTIWKFLISEYVMHGHVEAAISLFRRMQNECVNPNSMTYSKVLSACSQVALPKMGDEYSKYCEQPSRDEAANRVDDFASKFETRLRGLGPTKGHQSSRVRIDGRKHMFDAGNLDSDLNGTHKMFKALNRKITEARL